jgi:hypothetical protein
MDAYFYQIRDFEDADPKCMQMYATAKLQAEIDRNLDAMVWDDFFVFFIVTPSLSGM